jgi:hypothetical protein
MGRGEREKAVERHTEVLHEDFSGRQDRLLVAYQGFSILEDLLGRRVEQADAVVVADARLAGNQGLGILDGGIARELDRGREFPDRLFPRCDSGGGQSGVNNLSSVDN